MESSDKFPNRRKNALTYYDEYPQHTIPKDWKHVFNLDFSDMIDVVKKRSINRYIDLYFEALLGMDPIKFMRNEYTAERNVEKTDEARFILSVNELVRELQRCLDGIIFTDIIKQANPHTNTNTCDRIAPAYMDHWRSRMKDRFRAEYLDSDSIELAKRSRRAKELANIIEPGKYELETPEVEIIDLGVTPKEREIMNAMNNQNLTKQRAEQI